MFNPGPTTYFTAKTKKKTKKKKTKKNTALCSDDDSFTILA